MKKFISLLIAVVMFPMTVFASAADNLAAVLDANRYIMSAQVNATASTELNRPIEIVQCLPEFAMGDVDIDLALISESLLQATSSASVTYNMSDDFKKLDMEIWAEADVPIQLNDSFSMSAWSKVGMWMSYDFTDAENPMYKMILDIPFLKKYQVFDLSELMKENPMYLSLFDTEYLKEINTLATESLIRNSQITASGNTYTVKLDDAGMKAYISEIFDISKKLMDENTLEQVSEVFEEIKTAFNDIPVIGDDGVVMKITVDTRGNIKVQNISAHICLNVYDLLSALSKSTEGLEREKAYIDLTINSSSEVSGIGKTKAELPEVNDDNANFVDYGEDMYTGGYYARADVEPIFENELVYYPLDEIVKNSKIEMTNENGEIKLYDPVSTDVAQAQPGSGVAQLWNETFKSETPYIIEKDGRFYAQEYFLNAVHVNCYNAYYDLDKDEFYFNFHYDEVEPETDGEEPDEYEYIPPMLNYGFSIERFPYMKDNNAYMPIYEFVQIAFGSDGEFTFPDGQLTYKTKNENVHGIREFNARIGDAFVTVNGEKKPLSAPIEVENGVMYMPVDFAPSIGMTVYEVTTHYYGGVGIVTSYWFEMPNPDYEERNSYNVYGPKTMYFVNSDRMPYKADGELYMPAYDFVGELFEGEYTFTDSGFEYTASGENDFNISKISVNTGDTFVTVDDKQIELDAPVVSVDDVIRIPVSFAEDLELDVWSVSVNYGTTYTFEHTNLDYEYPLDNRNNWFYNMFN